MRLEVLYSPHASSFIKAEYDKRMDVAVTRQQQVDPTLQHVVELIVRMDARIGTQFEGIDERPGVVENRLGIVESGLEDAHIQLRVNGRMMSNLLEILEDVQEQMVGTVRAVDADAVTIIDHEARIRALEIARGGIRA